MFQDSHANCAWNLKTWRAASKYLKIFARVRINVASQNSTLQIQMKKNLNPRIIATPQWSPEPGLYNICMFCICLITKINKRVKKSHIFLTLLESIDWYARVRGLRGVPALPDAPVGSSTDPRVLVGSVWLTLWRVILSLGLHIESKSSCRPLITALSIHCLTPTITLLPMTLPFLLSAFFAPISDL